MQSETLKTKTQITVGSLVSMHRIEKGENQIVLKAPSPGVYFIEVEGAGRQMKWLVE